MDSPKEGGDGGREGSNGRGEAGVETGVERPRVVVGPLEGGESHITAEQH